MNFKPALLFLVLLAGAGVARGQSVSVDFDRGRDFAQFKTWSWVSGVPAKNPLIDERIRSSIEAQLAAKGLRHVEGGGDLSVLYFVATDMDVYVAASRWSTTGDWAGQIRSGISVRSQTWDVQEGTLVVCLSDGSDKELLWRGTASTTLDRKSRGNRSPLEAMQEEARKAEKKVGKAIEKMFRQYPAAGI